MVLESSHSQVYKSGYDTLAYVYLQYSSLYGLLKSTLNL